MHSQTCHTKKPACACAGEYTPVQQDQMDLASMVDCAFSMADWSTNHGATPSASYASPRSGPGSSPAAGLDAVDSTAAELRALDSMYTALSSLGFQVCSIPRPCSPGIVTALEFPGSCSLPQVQISTLLCFSRFSSRCDCLFAAASQARSSAHRPHTCRISLSG